MLRSSVCSAIVCASLAGPGPSAAATFDVFTAPDGDALGQFDAPSGGGLLTSASIVYLGALFDVLATGLQAPLYHADTNDVSGASGGGFGVLFNSVAFVTEDFDDNSVNCGIGECTFYFERRSGDVPGAWYVDKVLGINEPIALGVGNYEIAAVPLPASIGLLLAAVAAIGAVGRRRKA